MSVDTARPGEQMRPLNEPSGITRRKSWRWQHYMSCVALGFLFWEAWTITAWLADDPHPITKYRDPGSAAYAVAKGYEIGAVVIAVLLGAWVVRNCIRERRLTFDAQLCIAGGLAFWLDTFYNFLVPTNGYSSNFVNIGNWCGHAPFVVNKACGEMPEPIILIGIVYTFGFLGCALLGCAILNLLARWFPNTSMARRLVICAVVGACFDVPLDVMAMKLNLWNMFSYDHLILWDSAHRFPLTIFISAMFFFGGPVVMRYFKNDRGQTVFERGLDHLKPGVRRTVSFLSIVGAMQVLLGGVVLLTVAPLGLYAENTPDYPRHIVNDLCDTGYPGAVTGTAYGPCPGTPQFTAPLRRLPGAHT